MKDVITTLLVDLNVLAANGKKGDWQYLNQKAANNISNFPFFKFEILILHKSSIMSHADSVLLAEVTRKIEFFVE